MPIPAALPPAPPPRYSAPTPARSAPAPTATPEPTEAVEISAPVALSSGPLAASGLAAAQQVAGQTGGVQVWLSTIDQKKLLSRQDDVAFGRSQGPAREITVDTSQKFQTMDGFGASFTDSASVLLQKRLSPEARAQVMHDLFSRDGIHLSLIRQPMGACDYNINMFTYEDNQGEFSIDMDKRHMLPSVKQALQVNPDLKVMASPWSAPHWMKTSDSIINGQLDPKNYEAYGEYFAKFVEAYAKEGVNIWAVTPQNEPLFTPAHYPGMRMEGQQQADFIKTGLGPAFAKRGLQTKIMAYDHNWDRPDYPKTVLGDPEAARYVAGTAWHGYGGKPDAMSEVHDAFPDKGTWFTENSGGEWVPGFHDAFMDQTGNVIRTTRNWSQSVVWWNMALDKEHGPSLLGDWSTCRGLVTVDQQTGQVEKNVDYYTMGHISKFVEPGARRIGSNDFKDDVENVAFENPDGSKVLIVSNRTGEEKTVRVKEGGNAFEYTLPGEAAATFTWR